MDNPQRTRRRRNNAQVRRSKTFLRSFARKLRSNGGGKSGRLSRAYQDQRAKLEMDGDKHIPNREERRGYRANGMSSGRAA